MCSLTKRKHVVYIFLTAILSAVSLLIVCTSFGTQDWIRATAKPKIFGPLHSDINYGLFRGTLMRRAVYSPLAFDLYFTCIWRDNGCAWSCNNNEGLRKKEVEQLINGGKPSFSCTPRNNEGTSTRMLRAAEVSGPNDDRKFTNPGLWLTTIIFMSFTMTALFVSLILSIINSLRSPIQTFLNLQGIYVTNGIAFCSNFFVLMLYGICYDVYIKKDIAIYDTLVGDYATDADLGYSYWILMVPLIFEAVGIFLIAMRERIINSDRAETKIDMATDIPETGVLF